MCDIVYLYNYTVNILCIKTGEGYVFYSMLHLQRPAAFAINGVY